MQIIAITDIHGRHKFSGEVAQKIKAADLVLIAGDLTNFGDEKDAAAVLAEIQQFNNQILAIPGNCDYLGVNKLLQKMAIDLHGISKKMGDVVFQGLGGSIKTPFNTPQEYLEKELAALLENLPDKQEARYRIFVSHTPPVNTKLDRTFMGQHVGSMVVRSHIEKFKPDIVICGHIHEARGVDKIDKTILINPGPFPKHHALITIADGITYDIY